MAKKMHLGCVTLPRALGGAVKLVPSFVWSSLGTVGGRDDICCSPSAEGSCWIQLLVTGRSVWPCL